MKPREFWLSTVDRCWYTHHDGVIGMIHVREVMPDERGPFTWEDPDVLKGAIDGYKEQLEEASNRIKILENLRTMVVNSNKYRCGQKA